MKVPEFIFGIVALIVLFFLIQVYRDYSNSKKLRSLFFKSSLSLFILAFSWLWFIPMHIGWNEETSIYRFRFQVFEISSDDYGSVPNLKSNLFDYQPSRYGRMYLHKRIGGAKEYFTFKPVKLTP